MLSDTVLYPITITTLGSAQLRVVHRCCPAAVEYFGVAVDAGSRDETPGSEGLAHFVEHTLFKGTDRRRSWHIINRMEAVGGELNAFTTKEETTIYTIAPAGNLNRAADLVADLVTASTFPDSEIEKEREVVIDEINSYLDTPSEAVFDDFDDLAFAGTPLGHNILGSVETVRAFTGADCRRWLDRFYRPGRMVVFYMGPETPEKVFSTVERHFSALTSLPFEPFERSRAPLPEPPAFAITRTLGNHQAHTVLGTRIPSVHSPLRQAIALLNNIIGGPGMNSLLNVELRERRGLVYSVDSSTTLYSDSGLFTIYFGCDPDDTPRCLRLVLGTLSRLIAHPMSARRIAAAKRQYIGQLAVAAELREQTILSTARALLRGLRPAHLPAIIADIEALTPARLAQALALLHPSRLNRLTLA